LPAPIEYEFQTMSHAVTDPQATPASQPTIDTQRLDQAIRDGLALSPSTDVRSIAWGQTEEWDSVAHMQLVATLEAAFDILIDTDDVIAMSDYEQIHRVVSQNGGSGIAA
jgi:acyl carrier protein